MSSTEKSLGLVAYEKMLTMAKDAKDAIMAPIKANQMKIKGELKLAELEEALVNSDAKIQSSCQSNPIDFDAILSAIDAHELNLRRKRKLTQVMQELFPKS